VVRVARTVADLGGLDEIGEREIGQALSLRRRTDDDLGA
jgi:predicted ATPase with chaperone activity